MRVLSACAVAVLAIAVGIAPAAARDSYVQDGAGLFSAGTVTSLNQTIGNFHNQTGKEVIVLTVPSLDGKPAQEVAERDFAQQQVNGVMIFIAKAERQQGIIGDTASRRFFPAGTFSSIRQAMRGYFRSGDFDTGITTGVNLVIDQYRSHAGALSGSRPTAQRAFVPATAPVSQAAGGFGVLWLLLILVAGFLIIRAIFRALAGPRMIPPGYGGGPMGGPGFGGGPGYGGYGAGFGGGGGGGSFFSGLLGGLGGAFLGNELFGRRDVNLSDGGFGNSALGGGYTNPDTSGWQSDAGQADPGNASFGSFGGDGGGGFDAGGGDGGGGDGGW